MKHKRTDDKYWLDINNFNHLKYESDLENYIIDLENKLKEGKELSDEEIQEEAYKYRQKDYIGWIDEIFTAGAKWYREQLKQRQ